MSSKIINRIYMCAILTLIFTSLAFEFFTIYTGQTIPISLNSLCSELSVFIPILIGIKLTGNNPIKIIPQQKNKPIVWLLAICYGLASFYVTTITGIFAENMFPGIAVNNFSWPETTPFWQMFLTTGIIAPAIEEYIYRIFLFKGHKKEAGFFGAIFLSSVLFGLSHMEPMQVIYGTITGIFYVLITEVTGNILPAFFAHAGFNIFNLVRVYYMPVINTTTGTTSIHPVYLALFAIVVAIMLLILNKIANINNYSPDVSLYIEHDKRTNVLTLSFVITMLVLGGITLLRTISYY